MKKVDPHLYSAFVFLAKTSKIHDGMPAFFYFFPTCAALPSSMNKRKICIRKSKINEESGLESLWGPLGEILEAFGRPNCPKLKKNAKKWVPGPPRASPEHPWDPQRLPIGVHLATNTRLLDHPGPPLDSLWAPSASQVGSRTSQSRSWTLQSGPNIINNEVS